jgi:Domain of unknown function (DUF397)
METLDPRWRKSSYSGNGGDCVEVAGYDNHLMVRDSKNPEDAKLAFTTASWKAFTAKVKASLAHPLPTCKGLSCLQVPLRRIRGRFLVADATRCARCAAYLSFLAAAWLLPWWWWLSSPSAALARLGCWPG